jgi:hypothetical protein
MFAEQRSEADPQCAVAVAMSPVLGEYETVDSFPCLSLHSRGLDDGETKGFAAGKNRSVSQSIQPAALGRS